MKVLILTEGSKNIGFGHLTRCMALAQGLEEFKVRFKAKVKFVVDGDKEARDFLVSQKVKPSMLNWIKKKRKVLSMIDKSDLVIIDSYLAPSSLYSFFSQPQSQPPYFIAIDDYNRINYNVDMVINPSIHGNKLNYQLSSRPQPIYLLGKDYIILRREFWKVPRKYIRKQIKHILITFGGRDHTAFTKKLIKFLSKEFPNFNYHLVLSHPNLSLNLNLNLNLYSRLSTPDIRNLMLRCDLCISAGGQTTYELARLGIPTIGICFASNQKGNLEGLQEGGFLEYIGWHSDKKLLDRLDKSIKSFTYKVREKANATGRNLVDGQGVKRIVANLEKIRRGEDRNRKIILRPAMIRDCRDLWIWRNHPNVRKWSFCAEEIRYEKHKEWFEKKIRDKRVRMYIAENRKEEKMGQVRFEANHKKSALVNINLNPRFFGKGLGNKILRMATGIFMREETSMEEVIGKVIGENIASKKAFRKAGYVFALNNIEKGKQTIIFKFRRDTWSSSES